MNYLKAIKSDIWGALGFDSFTEFFTSSLTLKMKFVILHFYGILLGGIWVSFLSITEQTERFIYAPAKGIGLLFFVSVIDFMLGAANAKIIRLEDFNSNKIPRSIVRFGVQVIFVGIFYNLNSIWPMIIQFWIVDGLLLIFILTTVWSGIENARDLKIITEQQFLFMEQFVNPSKLFKRIFNKNQDK